MNLKNYSNTNSKISTKSPTRSPQVEKKKINRLAIVALINETSISTTECNEIVRSNRVRNEIVDQNDRVAGLEALKTWPGDPAATVGVKFTARVARRVPFGRSSDIFVSLRGCERRGCIFAIGVCFAPRRRSRYRPFRSP